MAYNRITQEMREAVKNIFFSRKDNSTRAIAAELNYSVSATSKIINDLLDEKMKAVKDRKNGKITSYDNS